MGKNAAETVLRIRKIQLLAKNWLNLKLRHRKAQKTILSGRYGDPHRSAGDQFRIWESCHVWDQVHEGRGGQCFVYIGDRFFLIVFTRLKIHHQNSSMIETANANT